MGMQRIYKKIKYNSIEKLKQWLVLHEVNTLRESQEKVFQSRLDSIPIRDIEMQRLVKLTKIKHESTLSKLSNEQYDVILSQAPPLGNNDLLKLLIEDLKIQFLLQIAAAGVENHDFQRGKLAGVVEMQEEIEQKIGEYNKKNSQQQKDIDFNEFDIISQ